MSNERRALKGNRFMAHLVGALEMGQDIGPYGRKVFATVAQYILQVLEEAQTRVPGLPERQSLQDRFEDGA